MQYFITMSSKTFYFIVKHTSLMRHADLIVELSQKEMCANGQSLWNNLVEEYVTNNKFKGCRYYSDLQNLAVSFSDKLTKDQINEIWRGTDACLDFAFEFLGAADYDSYRGNKLEDIIVESMELVFTDIICSV